MYYVYVLLSSKDGGLYVGFSTDLRKRINYHNKGFVTSTKQRRPLALIHYEAFINKKDAKAREVYLKSGGGHQQLNSMLKQTLNNTD